MNTAAIILLVLLQAKHFLVDFPLQSPWMFMNKGTYGHPGGIAHALSHAAVTLALLTCLGFDPNAVWRVFAVELLVHYHMDWAKVRWNASRGWKCNTHAQFWTLLGFDQLVHQLTYVWIAWMCL